MNIMIINGPNLNMLGIREPSIYGYQTYNDLCLYIDTLSKNYNFKYCIFQTNSEGKFIDYLQNAQIEKYDGVIINPGAYAHYSYAIMDALAGMTMKKVEVHLTDITKRENFRQISFAGMACVQHYLGFGFDGYKMALQFLA